VRRLRRYEDPEIQEMLENYRRAGITLIAALGFGVAWIVATSLGAVALDGAMVPVRSFPRLLAVVFGWGAATLGVVAGLQYLYAYAYIRLGSWR
jgi:hypothetical protein